MQRAEKAMSQSVKLIDAGNNDAEALRQAFAGCDYKKKADKLIDEVQKAAISNIAIQKMLDDLYGNEAFK